MEAITTAAAAYASAAAVQEALYIITTTVGMLAHFNPPDAHVNDKSEYDYIVVGGGTSGCVVGSRLSEDKNVSVLIVEAGHNFDMFTDPDLLFMNKEFRLNWNYTAQPDDDYKKCHRDTVYHPILGKVLGGDSSTDFMLTFKENKKDYDTWSKITNESSWSYTNVQRLFKKVKSKISLTKEKSPDIQKYFKALGQVGKEYVEDIDDNSPLGATAGVYNLQNGIRQNSAYGYLYKDAVRFRSNLHVMKKSQVIKIEFDEQKRATGVTVSTQDKTLFIKARREIIVAAGTINTVKLLQMSGIGPKNVLDSNKIPVISDLPVGKNYSPYVATVVVAATQETNSTVVPEKLDSDDFPSPTFSSYVSINKSNPYPEYITTTFIIPVTPPTAILTSAAFLYRYNDDIVNTWYKKTIGREATFTLIERTDSQSRGEVRIRSSNVFDPPIIDTKYYSEEIDVDNMIAYVKDFVRIYESPYFKELGAYYVDPTNGSCGSSDSDSFWRCYVRCLMSPLPYHSGTAAMGSVVDGRLRVIGVKGLRVADASVMPTPPAGGTTLAAMMVGENAAEMIKEDFNKGQ